MPREERVRPWIYKGAKLGFIRNGTYYIYRGFRGQRRRHSTGCRTAGPALEEYQRWEKDPARYVPRRSGGAEWTRAVVDFLAYSRATLQNSPGHRRKQAVHLAALGDFQHRGIAAFAGLDSFSAQDIRAFLATLTAGRPTYNRHLASLKALMSWARKERLTQSEADREVAMVREDRNVNPPREIPENVWRRTLAKLDARWRSACLVLLGAGLRYGELARMAVADIGKTALHVPRSKTRDGRAVPISPRCARAARKVLMLGGVPDDEASQLDHRIRVAAKKAKTEPFSAHELRHTFATVCLRRRVDLETLRRWLGHASIKTTQKYVHANPRAKAVGPV